jgi:hypothetical protein
MRFFAIAMLLALTAPFAEANEFKPIKDEAAFLSLVDGRELRIGLYNLTIKLMPDGQIEGRALGWDLTGTWDWKDGYFCRQMDWSGMDIPFDCQLVEARGEEVRFTVGKGEGDSALFRLR